MAVTSLMTTAAAALRDSGSSTWAPHRVVVYNPRCAWSGADSEGINMQPISETAPPFEAQAAFGARYRIGKCRVLPSNLEDRTSRPKTRSDKRRLNRRH
ncbi:MAG: hypothetical protein GY869_31300 [Planctomycetes bacterium]|nr:hypothetical protein [Planctomycetota bacterium]